MNLDLHFGVLFGDAAAAEPAERYPLWDVDCVELMKQSAEPGKFLPTQAKNRRCAGSSTWNERTAASSSWTISSTPPSPSSTQLPTSSASPSPSTGPPHSTSRSRPSTRSIGTVRPWPSNSDPGATSWRRPSPKKIAAAGPKTRKSRTTTGRRTSRTGWRKP